MNFISKKDKYLGMLSQYFLPLFPEHVKTLKEEDFTLSNTKANKGFFVTVLRRGIIYQAIKSGETNELSSLHKNYWKGKNGTRYHKENRSAFEQTFLPKFSYIIDILKNIQKENEFIFNQIVEIGSGSGQLLDHLSKNFDNDAKEYIGIDLSEATVKNCNESYGSENVRFIAEDADVWIRKNNKKNTIYISHRGVLEYFPREQLLELMSHISKKCTPNIIVTIEPISVDHDLESNKDSFPYSNEYSFSHNYLNIIEQAGFTILDCQRKKFNPLCDLIAIIAISKLNQSIKT